jgi:hypothetical protein
VIPKDSDLDIVATSFSPGVRRLMSRVGGKEAFAEGRRDLKELAEIVVKTKQVERVSEAIGEQMEAIADRQRAAALSGRIVVLKPVPKMYVAIDGTGVPMVRREMEGRQGKDVTGKAKTREAKLGCVFTQTIVDGEGWPVRDDGSTTYVSAIEPSKEFGQRIFTEAIRRGHRTATTKGRDRPRRVAQGHRILQDQCGADAIRPVPTAGPLRGLWCSRGRL